MSMDKFLYGIAAGDRSMRTPTTQKQVRKKWTQTPYSDHAKTSRFLLALRQAQAAASIKFAVRGKKSGPRKFVAPIVFGMNAALRCGCSS